MRELNLSERLHGKLLKALEDEVNEEIALYTSARWGDEPVPDHIVDSAMDTVIRRCVIRGGTPQHHD